MNFKLKNKPKQCLFTFNQVKVGDGFSDQFNQYGVKVGEGQALVYNGAQWLSQIYGDNVPVRPVDCDVVFKD